MAPSALEVAEPVPDRQKPPPRPALARGEAHDLRRAVAAWAEVVDLAVLDPPEVCERCHRPITPEDPIDYLEADDGSLEIVHERCPDTDPPGR
jgi:hypothetical protein